MFNSAEMKYQNKLLALLSNTDWYEWNQRLQPIQLAIGQVIYESGIGIPYIIFPTTAIVSLLHILEDGGCTEIAMVGRDGLIGVSAFMGGLSTPSRGVVQQAGQGYRISSQFVNDEFHRSIDIMELMLRYTQTLITQMSQLAVCNRHHSVEQQLCRWLLLNLELVDAPELTVTQEQISHLLGVRREGITRAAGKLQAAGLIRYNRGHLTSLNHEGIRAHACECFDVVKNEYARLLPENLQRGTHAHS
jgi:CRP-like cAMP-binding protein